MAGAGMAVGTTVTKVIAEVMARDVRGEVEERISQDQGNSHFPVLFLICSINLFFGLPNCSEWWSLEFTSEFFCLFGGEDSRPSGM